MKKIELIYDDTCPNVTAAREQITRSLAYRAKSRNGYRPFIVGAIGTTLIIAGKFAFTSSLSLYGGIGLLILASFWNIRPMRKHTKDIC